MYKLIGSGKSRAFRVIWMLEELGLEYEYQAVAPRSDEARAVNPSGKIPCFMDGDEAIIDSVAIIQYLADKHGKLTFKAGTIDRARQDAFTQFACDEMDGTLWTAARNTFVLPEDKRVPAIKDTLRWEYKRSMKTLAERLGDNKYLMGDAFTVADIVTVHSGRWGRSAKFETGQPMVEAYIDRAMERDAYQRAMAA